MANAKFWDNAAEKYARDPISNMAAYEETRERMRQLLQPDHKVLEIGFGTGSTALELADRAGSYLATDLSSEMIRIAESKQSDDTPAQLTFTVAEAGELPDGPFDVVIALNLLHLVEGLEQVVAQIYDALPSGGLFISKTTLLADGPWYIRAVIPLMRALGKAPFVRNLREAELKRILTDAGFELDDVLAQEDTAPRVFVVARKP